MTSSSQSEQNKRPPSILYLMAPVIAYAAFFFGIQILTAQSGDASLNSALRFASDIGFALVGAATIFAVIMRLTAK